MNTMHIDKMPRAIENRRDEGNPELRYGGGNVLTADEIKKKLHDKKWTVRQVSEALGHDPSWLSKKLHGARKMQCQELLSICVLTGIPPHELLGWKGEETVSTASDKEILAFIQSRGQEEVDHLAQLFDKVRSKK